MTWTQKAHDIRARVHKEAQEREPKTLQKLYDIPENDRTDGQWCEIASLERKIKHREDLRKGNY